MKKLLSAAVMASMMLFSGVASATLPNEDIALGSIAPGQSVEAAKAAFGKPVFENKTKMIFANGIVIDRKSKSLGIVQEIQAEYGCAVATTKGIKVGMSADALNTYCGKADEVAVGKVVTEYKYYSHDRSLEMEFEVEGGVITKIECERVD